MVRVFTNKDELKAAIKDYISVGNGTTTHPINDINEWDVGKVLSLIHI